MVDLATQGRRGAFFATGLFMRLDPAAKSLTVCSFGHVGPIFSRLGSFQPADALPVGILPNTEADPWVEEVLACENHGHRFIVFTDGLTEQFNLAGEMFGMDRLAYVFHQANHEPLSRVVERIRAEVRAFQGEALVKDDQALLALDVATPRRA